MNSKVRFVVAGICFIGLAGVFLVYSAYQNANTDAMRGCILSLEAPIITEVEKQSNDYNLNLTPNWRTVDERELPLLLGDALTSGKTDCSSIRGIQQGMDYWDNRISVAVRRQSDSKVFVKISSPGRDMKQDTDDDLEIETK